MGIGLGWVFDKRTIGELAYELQVLDGFLASPYRFVTITWDRGDLATLSVPEALPGSRITHALAVGMRRAVGSRWFLRYNYRLFFDDWGVVSHTGTTELQHAFRGERLILGLSLRGYLQSKASFHRERYYAPEGTVPAFRDADKMLGASWSVLASLRGEYEIGPVGVAESLLVLVKVSFYEQHFLDFAPLSARRALVVSIGTAMEF